MNKKCLIIEDDIYMVKDVMSVIKKSFPNLILLPTAHSVIEAERLIKLHSPDLVISDINLKDGVIFDLLKKYALISFKIIFITSYSKYAVQAFKFSALEFLEKPFTDEALISAINSAIDFINTEQYNIMLHAFFHNYSKEGNEKKIIFKNLETIHIVNIKEIVYLKADNNYSEVYINDGRKIVVAKPLKFYDDQLRNFYFFRSHQSYLVNLKFAKTFHKKDHILELSTAQHVAVASTKSRALLEKLSQFL